MSGARQKRLRGLLPVAALAGAPLLAALLGSSSERPVRLDLGPGDGPYVRGFVPSYEIEDRLATHWTTYRSEVDLPIALDGGGRLSYRYARVLPETANVEVSVAGKLLDRFSCRGGVFAVREALLAGQRLPLRVDFAVDSHERRNLGLKLDFVELEPGRGSRLRLTGAARLRPALLVALAAFALALAGWRDAALWLALAPLSAALVAGLLADPWLTHRLLTGVPEAVAGLGLAGAGLGRALARRGRLAPSGLRWLAALALCTFCLRAAAVNHPGFYYPDLRTHARLVEQVRQGGLAFFVSPAKHIWAHGVWRTEAYGRTYAFPYSPAFHLPFVPLGLEYDELLTAMKLWAAAVSVVPLLLVWGLAGRLGLSPLGALLMALVPTYTSRLSFAFLPALFGHAVDVAFLLWLACRLREIERPRVLLAGALLVCACQLAYVSGVVNVSVLVALLALFAAGEQPPRRRWRTLAAVLGMGLLGSAASLALYYRDFLPMLIDVLPRIAGGAGHAAAPVHPPQGFWEVLYSRTHDFFDGVYPLLSVAGLWLALRRGVGRSLLLAWLSGYFVLLLGRAKAPDIFLHGHETLLVTPLVCLASGEALAWLGRRGSAGRLASLGLLSFLAVQGLLLQWRALAAQLGNAR